MLLVRVEGFSDVLEHVDGVEKVVPVTGDLLFVSGQTVVVPEVLDRRDDGVESLGGLEELLFESWSAGSGRLAGGLGDGPPWRWFGVECVELCGGYPRCDLVVGRELGHGPGARCRLRGVPGAWVDPL